MKKQKYKPKPFTQQLAEQAYQSMNEEVDDKRTLCNVIKQAFRASQDDSHNLKVVRDLLLEALWMGQRMHDKLYKNKQDELKHEQIDEDDDEFTFTIDWSKFENLPARGNWD